MAPGMQTVADHCVFLLWLLQSRGAQDKGPHRHIPHPDMKLFWQERYSPDSSVPMEVLLQDLASKDGNPLEPHIQAGLKQLLAEEVR